MKLQDQLNRTISLKKVPKRIVSLVPSQTELLCDLGLQGALVGVTKFCAHPGHIRKEAAVVGGTKQIHINKIKNLQPDIILCNKEENTKEIVEVCQSICTVHVSDIYSINDSLELTRVYGAIFNKASRASQIIEAIEKEVDEFQYFIRNMPVLKVGYFIWKAPWMVAANKTFINYLLQLNKFENVFKEKTRYPEIDMKVEGQNLKIDLILLSSEPFPFKEVHVKEVQEHFPKTTIMLADGEMFSWYGSRLVKAFHYFKSLRSNLQNNQS